MTNHEICRFVNSKDIRKYLEEIDYSFTTAEAAWLVYQCRDATLKVKEDAWKKIIETMPDQSINSFHFDKPFESIHKAILDFIQLKRQAYEMFLKESPDAFYQYTLVYSDGSKEYDQSLLYSSYEKCFSQLKKELYEEADERDLSGLIRRSQINCLYHISTSYNQNGEIMDINIPSAYGVLDWDLLDFFDGLWFHFPAPFKKGDIICDPLRPWASFCNGPIVMTGCTPMWFEKDGRSHADISDMAVSGYFQSENGTLYQEITYNYMDFEYFPAEKLTGKKRILKALSNLIKEEIGLELFIKAYHLIILEETRNDLMPRGCFTDEGMKLAGIWEDNGHS